MGIRRFMGGVRGCLPEALVRVVGRDKSAFRS